MNKFATKFAASTMVLTMTMVGCHSDSMVGSASASTAQRGIEQASRLDSQARAALQRGDVARALRLAERAVELAPRDSGYRMLLADLYLRNGRFGSAETSYADVLELDDTNVRAGLNLALTQIAQGRNSDALVQLEQLQDSASGSDVGLAMALAGQPQRAIELLERAARGPDANGRTRQNLALAYALAGDWQRARTVAAQDVSPAELGARLQHWASLAQPSAPHSQVATLLGVTPAEDPGQPVRLALSQPEPEQAFVEAAPAAEAPVQFAEAAIPASQPEPEPVRHVEAPAPQPAETDLPPLPETIRYAEAPVVPAAVESPPQQQAEPASWWPSQVQTAEASIAPPVVPQVRVAAAPIEPAPERYTAAVSALSAAEPTVIAPTIQPARAARPVFASAPIRRASASVAVPRAGSGAGRYVVQLGAFSNPQNAERAWLQAERRFGLSEAQPNTTTINIGGRTLHRVSVAGFDNRAEASRLCASIQAQGGPCFVRATAGDAPVRWASRLTGRRA